MRVAIFNWTEVVNKMVSSAFLSRNPVQTLAHQPISAATLYTGRFKGQFMCQCEFGRPPSAPQNLHLYPRKGACGMYKAHTTGQRHDV